MGFFCFVVALLSGVSTYARVGAGEDLRAFASHPRKRLHDISVPLIALQFPVLHSALYLLHGNPSQCKQQLCKFDVSRMHSLEIKQQAQIYFSCRDASISKTHSGALPITQSIAPAVASKMISSMQSWAVATIVSFEKILSFQFICASYMLHICVYAYTCASYKTNWQYRNRVGPW